MSTKVNTSEIDLAFRALRLMGYITTASLEPSLRYVGSGGALEIQDTWTMRMWGQWAGVGPGKIKVVVRRFQVSGDIVLEGYFFRSGDRRLGIVPSSQAVSRVHLPPLVKTSQVVQEVLGSISAIQQEILLAGGVQLSQGKRKHEQGGS